jgi:cell division protein FtsQ
MSSAHVDPALVLRRRALRRSEGRRRLAVLVGALGMLVLPIAYWGLEHSSVFSISRVVVTGGTPRVQALVRDAVSQDVRGDSLLQVDASSLAGRLEALPDVRSANVDRAFPHTVDVTVVMERPVAFVRSGSARYVVSADGRVLRTLTRAPAHLPRLLVPAGTAPAPGHTAGTAEVRSGLLVLASVPSAFEHRVARLRGVVSTSGGVVAVFAGRLQVRLGDASALALKLHVAERLLGKMGATIRRSVAYVDVSAPARPAIGYHK